MPQQKKYCGDKQQLPQGYTSFDTRYNCLRRGFGACLYSGNKGTRIGNNNRRNGTIITFEIIVAMSITFIFLILNLILLIIIIIIAYLKKKKSKKDETKN